jgi:CheY-like chemotaxis protein
MTIRRREGAEQRIPTIARTAEALAECREECLAAGMDDFISKPVVMDALAEVFKRWSLRTARSA